MARLLVVVSMLGSLVVWGACAQEVVGGGREPGGGGDGAGGAPGGSGGTVGEGGFGGTAGAGGTGGTAGSGGSGGGGPRSGVITPEQTRVGPGELQRFFTTDASPSTWKTTCGAIESTGTGTAVWRAPPAAGSCILTAASKEETAEVRIEVVPAAPTVTHLQGLSGPSDLPFQLAADGAGNLHSLGWRSLVEFPVGADTWVLPLDLPLFTSSRLLPSPTGAVHALGVVAHIPSWLLKRSPTEPWVRMPLPPGLEETSFWAPAATVTEDGELCVALHLDMNEIHCADEEGAWTRIATLPREWYTTALGSWGGVLYALESRGRVHALTGGAFEPMGGATITQPLGFAAGGGSFFALGEGLIRWSEAAGAWEDDSEGLPTGCFSSLTGKCKVASLVTYAGALYAISDQSLYARPLTGDAPFQRVADLPPAMEANSSAVLLLAARGHLLTGTDRGLWRYLESERTWELLTLGGTEFGRHPYAIDFLEDGTVAFGAGSFRDDFNHLYRRDPRAAHWTRLHSDTPLPLYHDVKSLSLRADGAIVLGTKRLVSGTGPRGLLFFAPPGSATYEELTLEGLPAWNERGAQPEVELVALSWRPDDSIVLALDRNGLFLLRPGAAAWAPLGPPIEVRDLLVHEDELIVASSEGVLRLDEGAASWSAVAPLPFHPLRLASAGSGGLWVATTGGVFRLDGGTLESAGMGTCSATSTGVFAGGGHVYCSYEGGRHAELRDGRWVPIPGVGEGSHTASPLGVDPRGALHLRFGVTLRGALVRTVQAGED